VGDKIENEMDGASSSDGEGTGVYRVLVGKPEGKRQLGRPRRRWEDNIKMDVQEVGCGGVDWIEMAQNTHTHTHTHTHRAYPSENYLYKSPHKGQIPNTWAGKLTNFLCLIIQILQLCWVISI
jgi:hypothetical protein